METCHALERVGAEPARVHVNALMQEPAILDRFQMLVIPGGFSYGDDVAAGKILANQLRLRLAEPLARFRDSGRLILGICNGFQVLVKAGLLPGWNDARDAAQPVTLTFNDSGKFEDRWITLSARPGNCVYLRGVDRLELPIAHGEGKFVCRDGGMLDRLRSAGQIVLRYAAAYDQAGTAAGGDSGELLAYPANPNGSQDNIAGICDPTGRVLGLMPHPERHVDATQHPRWTRGGRSGEGDGLQIFRNAIDCLAS
jgi:phosphoribosylformylglycinamidine synthase I